MLGSLIAGWILFTVGVLMYLVSLWGRVKTLRSGSSSSSAEEELELDAGELTKLAEAAAKLVEAFTKFSEEIQFLLLGSGCLAAGIYLLQNRPF